MVTDSSSQAAEIEPIFAAVLTAASETDVARELVVSEFVVIELEMARMLSTELDTASAESRVVFAVC